MIFGLLATDVAPDRRSATLNLVYLPLYAAGIVGPALGAIVVAQVGLDGPFFLGAAIFLVGAATMARRRPGASPAALAG
jgi:MFS family permease